MHGSQTISRNPIIIFIFIFISIGEREEMGEAGEGTLVARDAC
jgi:hypothetical protein